MKRISSSAILIGFTSIVLIAGFTPRAAAQQTTSQSTSEQLNQLFLFETTPNKSAANEGYLNGNFTLFGFPHGIKQYRYQVQGQYSFNDQIAAGGFLPYLDNTFPGSSNDGFGDLTFYGQYKLDQFINPDIVNLTAQLDVVLPTGSIHNSFDTGRFGVRPEVVAYKNFGQLGPGNIAAYGTFGFTITTNSDVRVGLAATYQLQRFIGVIEFDDRTGDAFGRPLVTFTPGIVYVGTTPWELAVGVPLGANTVSPDWGVVVKLTYAFEK